MRITLSGGSLRMLAALLCLGAVAGAARATSVIVPSDDEMIIGARAIVRGQVLYVKSDLDPTTQEIFTYVTLRVSEVFKGEIYAQEVVVKEPGGVAGGRGSLIFGTPRFAPGERVLLYLDTWEDGSLRVYQFYLGKYTILQDAGTGQEVAVRAAPESEVTVLGRSPEGPATERMELRSFGDMVRQRVQATRERSLRHEAFFNRGRAVRVRPPEFTPLTGGGEGVENFVFLDPNRPPRWFEPDSALPVVFRINLSGAPGAQTQDDFVAAMGAWSSVAGSSLRVILGGTTGGCGLRRVDGENTISFNNCDGYFPASSGCSGVLAAGGITQYVTSQSRVINGTTFYRALEGDVSFNPYASCFFADRCRVQEVATHELGHALGLDHSADPDATMHATTHFDGRCAGLRADDINGIRYIYPLSGGSPPPPQQQPPPPPPPPTGARPWTGGVYRPTDGGLYLRFTNDTGYADIAIFYGIPGDVPVTGDWNGDGVDTIGVYRGGAFLLRNSNTSGYAEIAFPYGIPSDLPVVGDWDGDGVTTVGIFRNGVFYLRNSNTAGYAEVGAGFGTAGDLPVAGDWNGDGVATIGVYRRQSGFFYLRNSNSSGPAEIAAQFGAADYLPVVGDWNGDRLTTVGVFRNGLFSLRNSNTGGPAEISFWLGTVGDLPIAGRWR